MKNLTKIALTAAVAAATMAATAKERPGAAEHGNTAMVTPMGIYFDIAEKNKGGTLRISGPDEFFFEQQYAKGEAFDFGLAGMPLDNGLYQFELVVWPDGNSEKVLRTQPLSGSFTVAGGIVADPLAVEATLKDQVFLDDVIVDGSLCVGLDCVNGENFGFDTIRLKENNLRLHFDDTSSTSSFPSNDWRITINDSSNGGANKFSIDDATAGRTPFTIEAGAPANSLYVDDGGKLGLGTSTPVVDAHVRSGNTPTVRLEQDGSSGFTPQTWDMAGNEANFFIRDVSNGSQLPFRIFPGADTDSLAVAADGQVGVGTNSPDAPLEIRPNGNIGVGNAVLKLINPGGPVAFQLDPMDDNNFWNISSPADSNSVKMSRSGTGLTEFDLASTGDLTIRGELVTGGGTCGGGCDLVFTPAYELPSIESHAEQMWQNGFLPNVGPTIEGEPINLSDKTGRMLNELEKAHIYIEQLHKRLERLEQAMAANSE